MGDTHHTAAHGARTTDEDMNLKKIILVGVAALVLFAVGAVWAYFLMVGREADVRAAGPARPTSEMGKQEIGIVDQVPFDLDHRMEDWRADRRRHLDGYGWVDKSKGAVHIPIAKAMEEVVAHPPDVPGEGVPVKAAVPVVAPAAGPDPAESKPGRHSSVRIRPAASGPGSGAVPASPSPVGEPSGAQ